MKRAALAVLVLLLAAATAFADQNPNLAIGFEAENPPTPGGNGERVNPAVSSTFDVWVVFTTFGPDGGILGASFGITRTFSGFKLLHENLMGGLIIGDPEVFPYCAITSGANPVFPTNGMAVVMRLQYLYTGTPGTATFVCHATDGCVTADALNLLDTWHIYSNLGVNMDPPASPVEAATWGSIKAMYR